MDFGNTTTNIIRSGLVFNMDAANRKSYPKTGTSATDTVSNNVGTLNSTTFENVNNGVFNFDGSDDYISFTTIALSSEFTISSWINPTNLGSNTSTIINTGTSNQNRVGIYDSSNIQVKASGTNVFLTESGGNDFGEDAWQHVLIVRDNSNNITAFRNGLPFGSSTTLSGTLTLDSIFRFNTNTYSAGKLANTHIYNRALSSTEVAQNYNALKSRFE